MNGMMQGFNNEMIYRPFKETTPSRHMTVVFNVFVLFQIFNMLAARKIEDEKNIFVGVFTNPAFVVVWLIIAIGQYFIVQFGSLALKVHIAGLTGQQWILCIGVGLLSLVWNLVLKCVDDKYWPTMGDEDIEDVKRATQDYEEL
jgi:magnesium-transporting ATPase (P-type)